MSVIGIDLSTFKAHFVELEEDTDAATVSEFDFGKGDLLDRLRRTHYILPTRDRWDDAMAIGIERPAGQNAWHVSVALGAVLQCLPYGVLVEQLYASAWKRISLGDGHGHAKKPEVMAWVLERWPECPNQDAADGYGLAYAMRRLVRGEVQK